MEFNKYILKSSPLDNIVIIWSNEEKFQIEEIIISNPEKSSEELANEKYGEIPTKKSKRIKKFANELKKYFNGKNYDFQMDILNFDNLSDFQKDVLIAQSETPKGTVNTYSDIAKKVGKPKSYRAVGTALSKNPFPIVIPCHRTVKSDKTLGGFNGYAVGAEAKEILLNLEGVKVENKKVIIEE